MSQDHNIVLVTLDGLRNDKIALSPVLNNFCKSSLFFPKMFTVSPYTFTSHHAIFSGVYPSQNGVDAYYHILDFKKEFSTLPQILKKSGYFTSCDVIDDSVIPSQGFDEYRIFDEPTVNFIERHTAIIKEISKNKKFFLFLHYTELHREIVKKIIQDDKKNVNNDFFNLKLENENNFNSCIPLMDKYVQAIIDSLKTNNLKENTILIFISDHGMSLGEKDGEKFYGVFVYDYTINVFCSMQIPGQKSQIIKNQCSTIDLFPTILELTKSIDEKNFEYIQGKSLFPIIEGKEKIEREVFVETGGLYGPWPSPNKHNVFCIRKQNKKLIYNDTPQTWEFYNLDNDPHEEKNLFDDNSETIQEYQELLRKFFDDNNIETNLKS